MQSGVQSSWNMIQYLAKTLRVNIVPQDMINLSNGFPPLRRECPGCYLTWHFLTYFVVVIMHRIQ